MTGVTQKIADKREAKKMTGDERCSPKITVPALVPDKNSASGFRVEQLSIEVDSDLARALNASATPEVPGDVAEIVRAMLDYPAVNPRTCVLAVDNPEQGYCIIPASAMREYAEALRASSAVNVQRDSDIGILLSALRMHEEAVGESFDDDGGNVAQIEADYRDRVGIQQDSGAD